MSRERTRTRCGFAVVRDLDVTVLMVTHDLPYAYELCDRAVILDDGVITADGEITTILGNDDLLAHHRLELPRGFRVDHALTGAA